MRPRSTPTAHRWLVAISSVVAALVLLVAGPASAQEAAERIRIACVGEATTHSAHRENDPEYPELMGQFLDDDFEKDTSEPNPMSGGMLYGEGSSYRVGNFGVPKGSALIHPDNDTAESMLNSAQLPRAEQFEPDLVVVGPFGPHEPYAEVPISNFAADYRQLIEHIQSFSSSPALLICSPIPRDAVDNNTERRQIRDATLQVAADMGIEVIDLWDEFLGRPEEFADQNHLNLTGRQHMAQVIAQAVETWSSATPGSEPEPEGSQGGAATGGTQGAFGGAGGAVGGASGSGGSAGADVATPSGDRGGATAGEGSGGQSGGAMGLGGAEVTGPSPEPEGTAPAASTMTPMGAAGSVNGSTAAGSSSSPTQVDPVATSGSTESPPPGGSTEPIASAAVGSHAGDDSGCAVQNAAGANPQGAAGGTQEHRSNQGHRPTLPLIALGLLFVLRRRRRVTRGKCATCGQRGAARSLGRSRVACGGGTRSGRLRSPA